MMNMCCVTNDENIFRKRALRDAIMCIAWIKLFSITCYIGLYFMIFLNTEDHSEWTRTLQIMVLATIAPLVLIGILLIVGAMLEEPCPICTALFISVALAIHDILLGVAGAIYFIVNGTKTIHVVLAVSFIMLAISFLPVMGNDWYVMYTYKKTLECCSYQI